MDYWLLKLLDVNEKFGHVMFKVNGVANYSAVVLVSKIISFALWSFSFLLVFCIPEQIWSTTKCLEENQLL